MKILNLVARYIVGILFIISGLIKINDPVGTQIKLEEYFDVFATDISGVFHYFVPFALFLSVFLSVLEVALGVAVLVRFKMRWTATILLVLIVFFTFLTFYSAYFNKVTDCGCFGDALKLTPWQSFTKDIILLVLILIIFIKRKDYDYDYTKSYRTYVVAGTVVICTGLAIYAINYLPFKDFRAYKVGANIPLLMQPSEPYQFVYIMEKDGKVYELEKYPAASEGFIFKDSKIANEEKAKPKITDFGIWSDEGELTETILGGNQLLIVVHNTEKADKEELGEIVQLANQLSGKANTLVVTSANAAAYENFRHEYQVALPYAYADATLLKTMIRSNPGLILLKDGVVVGKWHNNNMPSAAEVENLLN